MSTSNQTPLMVEDPNFPGNDTSFVRPYMITGGRTVGEAGEIPIETLVVSKRGTEGLAPDHATVVDLCGSGQPLSIMEIALRISQPLGVARVLVADLTASQHVEQYDTAVSENEALVRRLLDGIRSL